MKDWQFEFLQRHQLEQDYIDSIEEDYAALLSALLVRQAGVTVIGIQGSQGSGKTTLCDYLCTKLVQEHGLCAQAMSLDDFYLARAERFKLSNRVHPLLATRGVPGTHDLELAVTCIRAIKNGKLPVKIPVFDKSIDDVVDEGAWHRLEQPLDVLFVEGWCWGLYPQPESQLEKACNELEAEEDPDGIWRHYVNNCLNDYQALFSLADISVMLAAPSFDCVYHWRKQQEDLLRQKKQGARIMSDEEIKRFVQFFERLTCYALLVYPRQADFVYFLDSDRRVVRQSCKH